MGRQSSVNKHEKISTSLSNTFHYLPHNTSNNDLSVHHHINQCSRYYIISVHDTPEYEWFITVSIAANLYNSLTSSYGINNADQNHYIALQSNSKATTIV